jgi:hypothetical protein
MDRLTRSQPNPLAGGVSAQPGRALGQLGLPDSGLTKDDKSPALLRKIVGANVLVVFWQPCVSETLTAAGPQDRGWRKRRPAESAALRPQVGSQPVDQGVQVGRGLAEVGISRW